MVKSCDCKIFLYLCGDFWLKKYKVKNMRRVLILIVAVVALMACSSEEIIEVRYLASERPEAYLYAADEQGENLTVAQMVK